LTQALATLHAALALDPQHPESNDLLGTIRMMLGDHQGALTALSRSPEIEKDPFLLPDLLCARFFNGLVAREEIERRADAEVSNHLILRTYLFALIDHPDPSQRDPEFVLRILREREAFLSVFRWRKGVEIIACVRLGDLRRAL